MTFINKKLPLNSAKENREIRRSPYSFSIVELQEIVSLMDTERSKIIKDIVVLTSVRNSYTVADNTGAATQVEVKVYYHEYIDYES